MPSNGSGAAPNNLVLCPDPVAIVDVVCGGTVAGGILGVLGRLGGGVTALDGGITEGSTEEVAVGVGRYDWDVC